MFVGKNSMICCLLDFCPYFAQSRRYEGSSELSPHRQSSNPQIKTWNPIHQWSFCQFLECKDPLHKGNVPLLKTFWRWFWDCCLFIFCPQEAQSYPNETSVWILTCAVAWPAQNFGWVKMFNFTRATVYFL